MVKPNCSQLAQVLALRKDGDLGYGTSTQLITATQRDVSITCLELHFVNGIALGRNRVQKAVCIDGDGPRLLKSVVLQHTSARDASAPLTL